MVTVKHTALIAALGLVIASSASAQTTTYDYSGELMTGTEVYTDGSGAPEGTPRQTTMQIDGTITLSAPLDDNLSVFSVTPTYAVFGDGGSLEGGPLVGPGASYAGSGGYSSHTLNFTTLEFSTNGSGTITDWAFAFSGSPLSFETLSATSTPIADTGEDQEQAVNVTGGWIIQTSDSGGSSWSVATAAPEIDPAGTIGALTLLLGIAAVAAGRRRA